jgi:hypothetical protein
MMSEQNATLMILRDAPFVSSLLLESRQRQPNTSPRTGGSEHGSKRIEPARLGMLPGLEERFDALPVRQVQAYMRAKGWRTETASIYRSTP